MIVRSFALAAIVCLAACTDGEAATSASGSGSGAASTGTGGSGGGGDGSGASGAQGGGGSGGGGGASGGQGSTVGTGGGGGVGAEVCEVICACEACSRMEHQSCVDDFTDLQQSASNAGCSAEFDALIQCVHDEGTCTGGNFDASACQPLEQMLSDCISV